MKEAAWQALSDPSALQTKFAGPLERGTQFAIDVPQGPVGEQDQNMIAADRDLKLTPQEKALYEYHLQNLYGPGGVDHPPDETHPSGSRSTIFNITVNRDGRVYVLPTVYGGQILSPGDAIRRAEALGFDRFPSYSNEDEAESRYQKMHDYMEKDTKQYLHEREQRRPGGALERGVTVAGEVVPMQRQPLDLRDERQLQEYKKMMTRDTLSRALGGTKNILPMTPDSEQNK